MVSQVNAEERSIKLKSTNQQFDGYFLFKRIIIQLSEEDSSHIHVEIKSKYDCIQARRASVVNISTNLKFFFFVHQTTWGHLN